MTIHEETVDGDPPVTSGDGMAGPRRTLGEEVKLRRSELGLTQVALARQGKVSLATLGAIERGDRRWFQGTTLANLDRALGWRNGTAQGLLNEQNAPDAPGLPAELVDELRTLRNEIVHVVADQTARHRPGDERLADLIDALDAAERALLVTVAQFLLDHRPR